MEYCLIQQTDVMWRAPEAVIVSFLEILHENKALNQVSIFTCRRGKPELATQKHVSNHQSSLSSFPLFSTVNISFILVPVFSLDLGHVSSQASRI